MFSLFVSLTVRPDALELFIDAIKTQATATLTQEPGCIRFDVCADRDDPTHFLLYETYVDAEAYQAHRDTAHFADWRRAADAYVRRQVNTRTDVIFDLDSAPAS